MPSNFADRWLEASEKKNSCLVVGIDPYMDRIPPEIREAAAKKFSDPLAAGAEAAGRFGCSVIEAVKDLVPAVKPQIAFFEALGPPGLSAYADILQAAQDAGLLAIADVKRGDIGSTATAYASAYLGSAGGPRAFPADAVTVSPYLGRDSIEPFVAACRNGGGGIFVLVRTSNPSAPEIQNVGDGESVHLRVARMVSDMGKELIGTRGYSSIGAVVGATYPEDVTRLRKEMPSALFLLPGFGAQGATAEMLAGAFDERGHGGLVAASRSILYAGEGQSDWRGAVGAAARRANEEINAVRDRG